MIGWEKTSVDMNNSEIAHGNCFKRHFAEDKTKINAFTSNHEIGRDKADIDTIDSRIQRVNNYFCEVFSERSCSPRTVSTSAKLLQHTRPLCLIHGAQF